MQTLQTYRVVNSRGNLLDNDPDFKGLTLSQAERILCKVLNCGANAYIQEEELSEIAAIIEAGLKANPSLLEVVAWFRKKHWSREQAKNFTGIGFCQPKFYLPAAWRQAKNLMDKLLVPLSLAYPHDYGRGKGKYSSNLDITKVRAEVVNLICGIEKVAQ